MSIGERLGDLRIRKKRTLKEQSETLGVSLNTVYRWEHGLTMPRQSSLVKIAALHEVPLEWLKNGDAAEEQPHVSVINLENNTEKQLIKMFRKLSENSKYKLLGYIERIYIEDADRPIYRDLAMYNEISV